MVARVVSLGELVLDEVHNQFSVVVRHNEVQYVVYLALNTAPTCSSVSENSTQTLASLLRLVPMLALSSRILNQDDL